MSLYTFHDPDTGTLHIYEALVKKDSFGNITGRYIPKGSLPKCNGHDIDATDERITTKMGIYNENNLRIKCAELQNESKKKGTKICGNCVRTFYQNDDEADDDFEIV